MSPPRPADDAPLNPPVYHILLALGTRTMHGYAMMEAVEARSADRISLLPGTLYSTLAKMTAAGLVEPTAGPEYELQGGRRRYYRVTPLGREAAERETRRLELLVQMAHDVGLGSGAALSET